MSEFDNRDTTASTNGYKVWEPLLLSVAVILGMMAGSRLLTGKPETPIIIKQHDFTLDDAESIADVIRYIEAKYVDPVHANRLIEKAIQSILSELDPHSSYISPDELREHNEKMRGNFDGIGIEFHMIRDTVTVISVMTDGPAAREGILVGDRILTLDDSLVSGIGTKSQELVDLLRGKKGSRVEMDILRPGGDSLFSVKMSRSEILIESVPAAFMLDEETGYIKITRFSANTYKEFMMALEDLVQKDSIRHLVVDLRDNPGGYLNEAVNILSQFFKDKGKLLVYTEGMNSKRADYRTTGKPFFAIANIAVLINEGSASASEIVAGAIQDQDRGIIIGRQSYGKGLVQEHYPLPNGGALRLTIARYFTPSGRLIQTPYFLKDGQDTLVSKSSMPNETTTYFTMSGREVFSDGGITPDFQINRASIWEGVQTHEMYSPVLEYAFYLLEQDSTFFTIGFDEFGQTFPSNEEIRDGMIAYFNDTLDAGVLEQIRNNPDAIHLMVKAQLASALFGKGAWYRILKDEDEYIIKAQELVGQDRKVTLKLD